MGGRESDLALCRVAQICFFSTCSCQRLKSSASPTRVASCSFRQALFHFHLPTGTPLHPADVNQRLRAPVPPLRPTPLPPSEFWLVKKHRPGRTQPYIILCIPLRTRYLRLCCSLCEGSRSQCLSLRPVIIGAGCICCLSQAPDPWLGPPQHASEWPFCPTQASLSHIFFSLLSLSCLQPRDCVTLHLCLKTSACYKYWHLARFLTSLRHKTPIKHPCELSVLRPGWV